MSEPIRSMTGFARVHKATPHGEIIVNLKSVNHRGLDLHFHLEADLDPFEGAMRSLLKRSVHRGHVDIRCTLMRSGNGGPGGLNAPLLRAYLAAFRQAAAAEGITSQPDLNQALRLPGMFGVTGDLEPDRNIEAELLKSLEEALQMLNQFRSREGAELAAFIREHNRLLAESGEQMGNIRSRAQPGFQSRLSEKLQELLGAVALDPQRIAQEVAILADRTDVSEELVRLASHLSQFDALCVEAGPVGRKLDFLLQELNREVNTIGSKAQSTEVASLVVEAKAALEKMREQAQNVE